MDRAGGSETVDAVRSGLAASSKTQFPPSERSSSEVPGGAGAWSRAVCPFGVGLRSISVAMLLVDPSCLKTHDWAAISRPYLSSA